MTDDEDQKLVDDLAKDLNDVLPTNFQKPTILRSGQLRIDHNKYLLVAGK